MRIVRTARLALSLHFGVRTTLLRPIYSCYSSSPSMSLNIPAQPSSPLNEFGLNLRATLQSHMAGIDADLAKEDESRNDFFDKVRKFHATHDDLAQAVKWGLADDIPTLMQTNDGILNELLTSINGDVCARESKLSAIIEKSRSVLLLHRFLTEGRLATQASVQPCNDSEYIGAALTFAQHLNQYVLGRACEGDVASINLCLQVVTELNAKMLEFDFRNGPLRRKYDGLKYAVRNIEDILFELSLQQGPLESGTAAADGGAVMYTDEEVASPTKRMRLAGTKTDESAASIDATAADGDHSANSGYKYIDAAEIDAIRARMDEYDQQREQVIKDSRDVQKLAKQGVYAVIRGQLGEARKKLNLAAQQADKIMNTVTQQPTLRQGGFSNSLEEWAEGAITLEWVANKRIPSMQELRLVNAGEYVGALADFTGEIGRLAVMHAGKRDFAAVHDIYQAELVVSHAISRLTGNRFGKKLEMVNQNAKKVGDVIYELTMLQRSGRSTRTKPADPGAVPTGSEGGKGDAAED